LPQRYLARPRKRSYIAFVETEQKRRRPFVPDISLTGPRGPKKSADKPGSLGGGAATKASEPVALRAFIEEDFEEKFIDIYESGPERRLVTSIEVLSPSNKKRRSRGWKKYLRKRQALLLGKANLVEIDLLRGGDRMPMHDPLPDSPYYVLVAREDEAPLCHVWPGLFDQPLPVVPVPLAKPDADLSLPLQALIEAVYEGGRYHEEIDYSRPPTPPLTPEEAAWLERRLHDESTAPQPPPAPKRRPRRRE